MWREENRGSAPGWKPSEPQRPFLGRAGPGERTALHRCAAPTLLSSDLTRGRGGKEAVMGQGVLLASHFPAALAVH